MACGVAGHHKAREKKEQGLDSYAARHDTSMIPGHECPTAMQETVYDCCGARRCECLAGRESSPVK